VKLISSFGKINYWFLIKNQEPQFKIETDADGNLDIDVIKKDNPYFNFIINASRVHWRKELEESFEKRPAVEAEAYFKKKNQFNIAGENLQSGWSVWTKIALDQQNILHWLFVATAKDLK
jgi:hypothetical protein